VAELRAYALAVAELRGFAGAGPAQRERLRTLARAASAATRRPLRVRDMIGPLYRRVPGQPVLRDDEPTPADLDALLAGSPVRPAGAAATWRLVETLVAASAWGSTRLPGIDLPPALLAATGLAVPPADGLMVGWCSREQASGVDGLESWLGSFDAWSRAAEREGRPKPDVIVFREI
jgi:hypothetical protein